MSIVICRYYVYKYGITNNYQHNTHTILKTLDITNRGRTHNKIIQATQSAGEIPLAVQRETEYNTRSSKTKMEPARIESEPC